MKSYLALHISYAMSPVLIEYRRRARGKICEATLSSLLGIISMPDIPGMPAFPGMPDMPGMHQIR